MILLGEIFLKRSPKGKPFELAVEREALRYCYQQGKCLWRESVYCRPPKE